jgi:hydrogenase/urease accessory protein HupE
VRHILPIIIFAFVLIATPATAHDFSASYSVLKAEGDTLRVEFILNLFDLHHLQPTIDPNGDGAVSDDEYRSSLAIIEQVILEHFTVAAPDAPKAMRVEDCQREGSSIVHIHIVYTFSHPITAVKATSTMPDITQSDHYHLLQIATGDGTSQIVLDANHSSVDLDIAAPTAGESIREFVMLGVQHIVTGYDHLAFLLGLLITTSTLKSLVRVVTSFTVAHSVTLALATFGLVSLPPRLIESTIALSIAYIAIENFMGTTLVHRWKVTFLFGLVHGFGFSNVLREMQLTRGLLGLSLFSFNVGVEIGQLAFVCAVFPIVFYLGATRWKQQVLSGTSFAIMALGFYWFVQRMFF